MKERVKNVLNYRKPAFWVIAVSLAVCAVAAVCFLTDPVMNASETDTPVTDEPVNNGQNGHNDVFDNTEPSHTYVCGATLYQTPFISSYFPDGSSLGTIVEQGNTLSMLDETSGESTTCKLTETQTYSPEEFYAQFPEEFYAQLEGETDGFFSLFPEDTITITRRTYQEVHLWEITTANGDTLLWIGDPAVRLYALIDLDDAFPFLVNGALWTYDPLASTVIPIRFELDGPVAVSAGALSRDLKSGKWSEELSVESGETIYWMPSQNSAPEEETALKYRFQWDSDWAEVDQWRETLTLRPAMGYQGKYGSKTYGISNNWLGAASSAIHRSVLCVDMETGELVISLYGNTPDEGGPYAVRRPETSGGITIKGNSIPPQVTDIAAVQ